MPNTPLSDTIIFHHVRATKHPMDRQTCPVVLEHTFPMTVGFEGRMEGLQLLLNVNCGYFDNISS